MPRRRTSNASKRLKGTDLKGRIRHEPFEVIEGYPDPPAWLTDSVAVEEFNARARDLVDAGVMTQAAVTTLAHYAASHADIVRIREVGKLPTSAMLTSLRLYATEFGFTPASRSKAGVQGGGAGKPANRFDRSGGVA